MADIFVARAKWGLSGVMKLLAEASKEEQAVTLEEEALAVLREKFDGELPEDITLSAAFEALVFYWSR